MEEYEIDTLPNGMNMNEWRAYTLGKFLTIARYTDEFPPETIARWLRDARSGYYEQIDACIREHDHTPATGTPLLTDDTPSDGQRRLTMTVQPSEPVPKGFPTLLTALRTIEDTASRAISSDSPDLLLLYILDIHTVASDALGAWDDSHITAMLREIAEAVR